MIIASHAKPTVVCVDDEPLVSRSLCRLLSREPYDVLVADTPRKALHYVRDFEVDLVISDQRMPDMSGVELLQKVREVSPSTAGLLLTAFPESVLAEDPPRPPGPTLFAKPWDDDTLREGIRDLLTDRRAAERPTTDRALLSVLVPVDGSIEPELALGSVLPLLMRDPVRFHLLQVASSLGLHRDIYAYLERLRLRLGAEGLDAVGDVRWGDPLEQILLHARHHRAELIVLTQPRKESGFRRTLAERILEKSGQPVLVGRADLSARPWRRILVPLDGSRGSEAVMPDAVRIARQMGMSIDLLGIFPRPVVWGYAWPPPEAQPTREWVAYLMDVAKYVEMEDVLTEVHVVEGDPADEVLQQAAALESDLICMAAQRLSWPARLFGGRVREVVRRAPCPVFLREGRVELG